jgi:ring-1,2-phenylacetyl-CoA epoxidase subunit PaaA
MTYDEKLARFNEHIEEGGKVETYDLVTGKSKFHNVFHYPVKHWGDVAIIGWLIDGAALVTQAALRDSSYAPYARVLKRICAEEQLHLRHGEHITMELSAGTEAQRELFQEALNRWWLAIIHFFGPRSNVEKDLLLRWKVKTRTNEDLRQEFLDRYVPKILELGYTFPTPVPYKEGEHYLVRDEDIDWEPLNAIKKNQGPETERRLNWRRGIYDTHRWVRDAMAEPAVHVA